MRQTSRSSRGPSGGGTAQGAYYAVFGLMMVVLILWTATSGQWSPPAQALWRDQLNPVRDEATALENECRFSLIHYHSKLSEWFSGRSANRNIQVLWNQLGMAEDTVLVMPDGSRHDGPEIRAMLLKTRGGHLKTFVTEPTQIALLDRDGERSTTWSFVEIQQLGDGRTHKIKSKAICEWRGDRVAWVYIEEQNM